jgi:hypothetical protein
MHPAWLDTSLHGNAPQSKCRDKRCERLDRFRSYDFGRNQGLKKNKLENRGASRTRLLGLKGGTTAPYQLIENSPAPTRTSDTEKLSQPRSIASLRMLIRSVCAGFAITRTSIAKSTLKRFSKNLQVTNAQWPKVTSQHHCRIRLLTPAWDDHLE